MNSATPATYKTRSTYFVEYKYARQPTRTKGFTNKVDLADFIAGFERTVGHEWAAVKEEVALLGSNWTATGTTPGCTLIRVVGSQDLYDAYRVEEALRRLP